MGKALLNMYMSVLCNMYMWSISVQVQNGDKKVIAEVIANLNELTDLRPE
jgi:hypothetical protein